MSELKQKLTVSASPHFRSRQTSSGIMLDVIIALIPSLVAAYIIFGVRTLILSAVSVISCVAFEYVCRRVMKRHNTISDLSAVVTGLLVAFNVPATLPLWMVIIGDFFAIVIAKQFFGGIGQNFVNPALIGRIVLMSSFPSKMGSYPEPLVSTIPLTSATPLASLKSGAMPEQSLLGMFLGLRGGALGEVCIAALIIGFIYLLVRRVISWHIPVFYIGTVAVIMLIAGKGNFEYVLYELMAGGLVLGAVFMATDYTTSPVSTRGKILYAVGCGLLTSLIRVFGNLPEGVSFSIIIMNILVPLIEHITTPKPFGTPKKVKEAEGK
ncbi:MAG: RnfABCDGE type electron transport complex subunit D [Oscillospiraceae bacterium]|nr:RnfABCDGE type electron transport complex subunit D [Oscillospiraceae bacterium]